MKFLLGAVAGVVSAVVVVWLLFFQSGIRIDLSRPAVVQRICAVAGIAEPPGVTPV